ncbi:hypothetical protein DRE_01152 [Drechslerella stenobrocha 248]|uniref:glucan endo-1,3-beta-D-glucosidase n=1 Tax=Drechslerella stenobrocha 248 TaxID=1043628 RepID=W7HK11_9PEZI|nr:hypothetical protein DRE_01152 [Drechslerella stenobrocha 248]
MLMLNILSFGLKGALMLSIIGAGAAPVPGDTVTALASIKALKGSPFNPDIPVPEVEAPPNSAVPINGTILARDGSVLSVPAHERTLSNPLIRARATVYRPSVGYFAGFNLGTYTAGGGCKSLSEWKSDLQKVKSFNNQHFQFSVIKVFTTSQCSCLSNALQAAKQVGGIKIWAGLWTTPYSTFVSDKNELGKQLQGPNGHLIHGVSVGSEELFRGTMSAATLAGHIWDVKGMVQNAYGKTNVAVGTSDGIAPFLNGANQAVLDASDVAMVTDYPYYGGVNINQAFKAFQRDWWALGAKMGGRPLIVGESGWPSMGSTVGQAVATISNAGKYFRACACWMRSTKKPFFWFSGIDEMWKHGPIAETRFGVSWDGGAKKFAMTC